MRMSKYFVLFFLLLLFLTGCVSIPAEAPELSAELGNRIAALEESNLTLLHTFFGLKRQEVDRFIEEEWVPTFAEEFFKDQRIAKAWNTIVAENDKSERLKFIVKLGPKLQTKINEKRLELIQPLEELERQIDERIRNEYNQARAINNSITSFLLSAAKVAETRDRYLEMVGITEEKTGKVINKTDEIVGDFLEQARKAEDKTPEVQKYLEKIRELKDSI